MHESTPRNFVLQLGALLSLYLSVSFILVLLFGLVNTYVPDPADAYYSVESTQSSMRLAIAMLIVFFPAYLALTRVVNQIRRKAEGGTAYLQITRWLIYLSLLVAGVTILIDLVVLLMAFLEGELTLRFILKIMAVFIVVSLAFFYYLKDVNGYWLTNESKSKLYAIIASGIVVAALVSGFFSITSPSEVRLMNLDSEKITDLRDMQWRIDDYHRTNDSLPESLRALYEPFPIPTPPDASSDYTYRPLSEDRYELCAEFNLDSNKNQAYPMRPVYEMNYNWEYQAGNFCFERVIEVQFRQ